MPSAGTPPAACRGNSSWWPRERGRRWLPAAGASPDCLWLPWHSGALLLRSETRAADLRSWLTATLCRCPPPRSTPKLPLLPPVTARHRVAGAVAASKLQHSSTLSAPLLGGIALARAELSELVPGSSQQPGEGAVLRLELLGRSKRSRGLAGGVQVQPALVSSFGRGNGGSGSGSKSGSDSDDEEASSSSKACGSGSPDQQPRRLPGLRLEMAPHALRGWDGVSGRWQQAWGSRLCSTVAYQARQRRWNLDLSHKLNGWLTAAGSMACDMREAAAAPGPASGSEEIEAAEGGGVADRLRQLSAHLRGYAAGASVCRAKLRLTCKLRQPARQLRLESSYGAGEEGATHSLAYRCGRRPDHAQQHGWWDMGVEARPAARHVYLRLDFFAPL